jgi:UDPglucose 6-dehydrogenase
LATKISFINEMANICELTGADVNMVAKGMGLDRRIGPKFLHAGPGLRRLLLPQGHLGHRHHGQGDGYTFNIVEAVMEVNRKQRDIMVEKIKAALGGDVTDKVVACLGLTFKPNTDDMRDSPSLVILPELIKAGASVRAFDPAGTEMAKPMLPAEITYCDNAYHTCQGADILVLMTEWNQFRNLDWARVQEAMRGKVVVDLRNVYQAARLSEHGMQYHSVGRPF